MTTWNYDTTYQLTRERRNGANSYDTTYSYDAAGNRVIDSELDPVEIGVATIPATLDLHRYAEASILDVVPEHVSVHTRTFVALIASIEPSPLGNPRPECFDDLTFCPSRLAARVPCA